MTCLFFGALFAVNDMDVVTCLLTACCNNTMMTDWVISWCCRDMLLSCRRQETQWGGGDAASLSPPSALSRSRLRQTRSSSPICCCALPISITGARTGNRNVAFILCYVVFYGVWGVWNGLMWWNRSAVCCWADRGCSWMWEGVFLSLADRFHGIISSSSKK